MKSEVRIIHYFLDPVTHQSRLYKEARFVLSNQLADSVFAFGPKRGKLRSTEQHESGVNITRHTVFFLAVKNFYSSVSPPFYFAPVKTLISLCMLIELGVRFFVSSIRLQPTHVASHVAATMPLVFIISRVLRAKFIYLPHELEAHKAGRGGALGSIESSIERRLIRYTDSIVTVNPPIAEWYVDNYSVENCFYVRNLPEITQTVALSESKNYFRRTFNITGDPMLFLYQGLLAPARGIEELLAVFGTIKASSAHIIFMGYGDESIEGQIKSYSSRHDNIHIHAAVASKDLLHYTCCADIGVSISPNNELSYRLSLGNKIFEYLHAGLPVLVSDNLEYAADLISQRQLGVVVSMSTLRADILQIIECPPELDEQAKIFISQTTYEADAASFYNVYSAD